MDVGAIVKVVETVVTAAQKADASKTAEDTARINTAASGQPQQQETANMLLASIQEGQ